MLALRDVQAGYGSATVLRGVSLDVADGETVALVGANGAGKSTLLKTISGLVRVRGGDIALAGASLAGVPAPQRVRRGIAHVPEGRDVFGGLTVGENLRLGAYAVRRDADARELERRLEDVLERFPVLRERLDRPAAELSGGQQQMLAIGRGLMARPRLLLLDEPSLGLSPALVERIFAILRDLRGAGISVLIAEQNARMTLAVADRGYVLENGSIVAQGSGRELLESPQIVERYLGIGSASGVTADDGAAAGSAGAGASAAAALTDRLRAILAPAENSA
ncbi:MAG: branched-chain amino acid transport system ATP-binding protein [Candidatus Eremiobacteraeota bacterium]|nr:branched-chain amino acid transport system ATP-binding protein [Candidatus Eremiobacteraeota bacterium]